MRVYYFSRVAPSTTRPSLPLGAAKYVTLAHFGKAQKVSLILSRYCILRNKEYSEFRFFYPNYVKKNIFILIIVLLLLLGFGFYFYFNSSKILQGNYWQGLRDAKTPISITTKDVDNADKEDEREETEEKNRDNQRKEQLECGAGKDC